MEQLVAALNTSQEQASINFIDAFLREKPLDYVAAVCQLVLGDQLSVSGVKMAVVSLRPIFHITFSNTMDEVSRNYSCLPEALQQQLKQMLTKCLMYPDETLVRTGANILAIIAKLEIESRQWRDCFSVLASLCESAKNGDFPILGPMVLLEEIFRNVRFKPGPHNERKALEILGPHLLDTLSLGLDPSLGDVQNSVIVLAKAEAAKAMKHILKKYVSTIVGQSQMVFAALMTNAKIPIDCLNRAVCSAIRTFIRQFYTNLNEEIVGQLLDLTQWGLSTENSTIQTNVITIWDKLAQFEREVRSREHPSVIRMVAPTLMPPMLNLLRSEDVEEAPMEWGSGRTAYYCLLSFVDIIPELVFQFGVSFLSSVKPDNSPQDAMTTILVFQIMARIKADEVIPVLLNGFTFLAAAFSSTCVPLVKASLVVFMDLLTQKPQMWDDGKLNPIGEMISTGLKYSEIDVVMMAALLASTYIHFLSKYNRPRLEAEYVLMLQLLANASESTSVGPEHRASLLTSCYKALVSLIEHMPNPMLGETVADFIFSQIQGLQAGDGASTPKKELLCMLYGALVKESPDVVRARIQPIYEFILGVMYELKGQSHEVLGALGNFFYYLPDESMPHLGVGIELAESILGGSAAEARIGALACQLIGDMFRRRHQMLIDKIPVMVSIVIKQLLNFQGNNVSFTACAMYAIAHCIKLSEDEEDAELAAEIGRRLMETRVELMKVLRCASLLMASNRGETRELSDLFDQLLLAYAGVALIYDWEGPRDERGRKMGRGDFLETYALDFVDVVGRGEQAGLYTSNVGKDFVTFMRIVMDVFTRANHFNIKLHGRAFRRMWDRCLDDERVAGGCRDTYAYWSHDF